MKRTLLSLLIGIILILTQAASCTKPDKKNLDCTNNSIMLPQLAKDLLIFNSGSWWVYKNVSSNEIDSFYVDYVKRDYSNNYAHSGGMLNKCYESNSISLISKNMGHINYAIGPLSPDGIKTFENTNFSITTYTDLLQNGYNKFLFKGDSIIQSPQVGSQLTFKDSIAIQNTTYYNIVTHIIGKNNIDFYEEAIMARKIGLIRFKRSDNASEWELIRYNIVK